MSLRCWSLRSSKSKGSRSRTMNGVGDKHSAGIGERLDPCCDVDAVAVEIVGLDDHVTEIGADAQFDAAVRLDPGVPLGHRLLHRDRAAHRIDDAGKLHQQDPAAGLDDVAPMLCDLRIEQLALQRFEAFESPSSATPISREYPLH